MNPRHLSAAKKLCAYAGLSLLFLGILLFVGALIGLFDLSVFDVLGQSGLRSLAALSVAGCLLAAIGYFEE